MLSYGTKLSGIPVIWYFTAAVRLFSLATTAVWLLSMHSSGRGRSEENIAMLIQQHSTMNDSSVLQGVPADHLLRASQYFRQFIQKLPPYKPQKSFNNVFLTFLLFVIFIYYIKETSSVIHDC